MKRKLVFWTCLNSYKKPANLFFLRKISIESPHPTTTLEWTRKRVELFKTFNLPPILKQTHDDLLYLVLLDPESKNMIDPLLPKIDDRVKYVYEDKEYLESLKEYDELVYAYIDSDDMYSLQAGEIMMNPNNAEWGYFKFGFIYNSLNGDLWKYNTITSGPFFVRRIDPKIMKEFDRTHLRPGHKQIAKFPNSQILPNDNFCVLLHDTNTSSNINTVHVIKEKVNRKVIFKEKFGLSL